MLWDIHEKAVVRSDVAQIGKLITHIVCTHKTLKVSVVQFKTSA